jgi:hypothetical protein
MAKIWFSLPSFFLLHTFGMLFAEPLSYLWWSLVRKQAFGNFVQVHVFLYQSYFQLYVF